MAPGMAGSKFFRVAMDRGQVFGRKSVKTTLNLIPIALSGSVRMKFRRNPDEFRRNPDEFFRIRMKFRQNPDEIPPEYG